MRVATRVRNLFGIFLLSLGLPLGAVGASLTFDFEDGLQGWQANGAVTRVPTQVLGGSYAIFGDGLVDSGLLGNSLSISLGDLVGPPLDPFPFDSLSVDFQFGGDVTAAQMAPFFIQAGVFLDAGPSREFTAFPVSDVTLSSGRSGTVTWDLSGASFPSPLDPELAILWSLPDSSPANGTAASDLLIGLVDNITFVPEPSTALLLATALAGLIYRRPRTGC